MNWGETLGGWVKRGLPFVAVGLTWALLNRLAGLFEFMPGVSFFFPAAAVTAVGAAWVGPWGALAVWMGNFLFPWGAAVGPVRTGLFGLPEVLFYLVMVAALKQAERQSQHKLVRVVGQGVVLGTLASAATGTLLLSLIPPPSFQGLDIRLPLAFISWWVSDLTAACTLGLAGIVLVCPQAVLAVEEQAHFRTWQRPRVWAPVLFGAMGAALVVGLLTSMAHAKPHWFALLFLPALAVAAFRGGTGAALVTNGLIAALHLLLVVGFDRTQVHQVTVELGTAYGYVLVFTAMAWLLGSQAAANRSLLRQVRQQSLALEEALEQIVLLLAQALEAKERGSRGHAQRVAELSVKVGESLGLSYDELKVLRRAALLHDVGKVAVGEAVLNQPVELEPEGRDFLRKQLAQGVASLRRVELLGDVMAVVEAVNERWDGRTTGDYPGRLGLSGEAIPLAARIIAAVRAYDAMTHPKPWRPARTREEAVAELWRCSGSQFDPQVVRALTEILGQRWDVEADRLAG
ncbi:MAG: HD domain-containing phosphohydrolase [Acidobacteriota bacterium]